VSLKAFHQADELSGFSLFTGLLDGAEFESLAEGYLKQLSPSGRPSPGKKKMEQRVVTIRGVSLCMEGGNEGSIHTDSELLALNRRQQYIHPPHSVTQKMG